MRVLGGKVPAPPTHLTVGQRYSKDLFNLVEWILKVDRNERPSLSDVIAKVELMISEGKFGINTGQFIEIVNQDMLREPITSRLVRSNDLNRRNIQVKQL